jgi:histidinol phosphatase-like PHP family hydrolase
MLQNQQQTLNKKIDAFNKSQNKLKVLFGYEVNILADETLAISLDIFAGAARS